MKRMRKFLAAMLAAATVFSMSMMPAFASETTTPASGNESSESGSTDSSGGTGTSGTNTEKTDPITSLTFTKKFESEKGGSLPNATFTFTMTPAAVTSGTTYSGVAVVEGLPLATATATVSFASTVNKDAEGTGTFSFALADNASFAGPKVYSYVVKETIPEDSAKDNSIDYDDTEYTVYLIVDNTNKVTAVVNASTKTYDDEGNATNSTVDETVAKKPIEFTNICSTDTLVIKKEVKGAIASKTDKFKFQILIPVAGGTNGHTIDANTTYTGTITRAATGSSPETVQIVVKDSLGDNENIVELADGDFVTINGLPESTIYTVTELGATDYTTTIVGTVSTGDTQIIKTVNKNKVYDSTTEGTPIVDGGNTIVYTNEKDITPTGLVLAFGPQILVLLIAVGGALVIFKTRKKRA